jgi:hypothetical protein
MASAENKAMNTPTNFEALSPTTGSRRDTSMSTAPRDGRLLRLHRYGQPRIFTGRWAANDGVAGWWHNEKGERMTHVHSWEPHRENEKSPDAGEKGKAND